MPGEEEPTPTPCTVICHTEGCPLDGVARIVDLFPNVVPPTYRASCGQCDQAITDITPMTDPASGTTPVPYKAPTP